MGLGQRVILPGGARPAGAPSESLCPACGELAALLEAAWRVRAERFPPEIRFVRPEATLSVSLTGTGCRLGCAHCGGHYLRRMAPLSEALEGSSPRSAAATSFLVSGGCLESGAVPFGPALPELRRLKSRGRLNFHVGLVGEAGARSLEGLADAVSFDLVGDDSTIREVLGLDRTVSDYRDSLRALRRHVRVVPHILVGLHGGVLRGERAAVELAASEGCEELVFIVLIPTPGTRFEACRPPAAEDVVSLIAETRVALPSAALGLGCMRPGGTYRSKLDPLAVRAGVQTLVQPSPQAIREAGALGLAPAWSRECCVL